MFLSTVTKVIIKKKKRWKHDSWFEQQLLAIHQKTNKMKQKQKEKNPPNLIKNRASRTNKRKAKFNLTYNLDQHCIIAKRIFHLGIILNLYLMTNQPTIFVNYFVFFKQTVTIFIKYSWTKEMRIFLHTRSSSPTEWKRLVGTFSKLWPL